MVNSDSAKCICQGRGEYTVHKILEGFLHLNWSTKALVAKAELVPCVWHNMAARAAIQYPDGWEEEDLRQWCKQHNVPEPEWLPVAPPTYERLEQLYKAVFVADPVLSYLTGKGKQDFPGGKNIVENFLYKSKL